MLARCSIRLSTPPSEVARFQSFTPAAAVAVAARTRLFTRATSLGGVESLIEHRASMEGPDTPVPVDLLRLSAGIEATTDLIADLEQALEGL